MKLSKFKKEYYEHKERYDNQAFIEHIFQIMPKEVQEEAEYLHYIKNSNLVTKSDPVNYAFITITGEITVVNEFESGKIFEPVVISPSDFTCVVEIILDMDEIIATNMTRTDCTLIRIPRNTFKKWLDTNHEVTKMVLEGVCINFMKSMIVSGENILLDTMYLLLRHLLNSAIYEPLSKQYTLHETREKTSSRTGINLRTLYRHIKHLKNESYIGVYGRNITYSEKQREAIIKYVHYLRNK